MVFYRQYMIYQTRKKNSKFCSKQCAQKATTVKYTDNELVYLAMINPGYGFRRFVTTLYASRDRAIPKCIEVFNKAKEMGMDPYDCLQDPSYMRKVDVFEYLEKSHVHKRENQQSLLTIADVLFQYETAQINIQYH